MKALAIVIALVSAVLLVLAIWAVPTLPVYVAIAGLFMSGVVWQAARISDFLRIFVAMYGAGFLAISIGNALQGLGYWPAGLNPFLPPSIMAAATAVFAGIVFGASFIPAIRMITAIADPYFRSAQSAISGYGVFGRLFRNEGRAAATVVGIIIAETFLQVALTIKFNFWQRDLFNSLQNKDQSAFWTQIFGVFVPLLVIWIIVQLFDVAIASIFQIRWRQWMTARYYTRWLDDSTHYRMQLRAAGADNPDQRIAVDVDSFIAQTMSLSIRLLQQLATLVSFTVILWNLSREFTFPGTLVVVPGFLVWVALAYAVIGTICTHLIGRPLIRLDFLQQRFEANFRFALARLREYGEQVALMRGADSEKSELKQRFSSIVSNYFTILKRQLRLTGFTFSWRQMSVAFPYILMGSYFFSGKISLGDLTQGSGAFGSVESALSFFMNAYSSLASFRATIDRLTSFGAAMQAAEDAGGVPPRIAQSRESAADVRLDPLSVALPDGRAIVRVDHLTLKPGQSVLLSGPSGSGKSTLFRAISGIWPYGHGLIDRPESERVMLLPQKPYLPTGTLRKAVTYPAEVGTYDDAAVKAALAAVQLGDFGERLDEEDLWSQRLSGGEQQRLAVARALLTKPDWLFLDESTSALDETSEALLYRALDEYLPETTIVSIGHRSALGALHDRRIEMRQGADGLFAPMESPTKAAAAE